MIVKVFKKWHFHLFKAQFLVYIDYCTLEYQIYQGFRQYSHRFTIYISRIHISFGDYKQPNFSW